MLGFVIGLVYAGFLYIFGGQIGPMIVDDVSHFWLIWYAVTSGIVLLLTAAPLLGVTAMATAAGARSGGLLGGVLGAAASGGISFIALLAIALRSALLIGGSYLLTTAGGDVATSFSEMDTTALAIGGVMVFVGVMMGRSSSSSSSSD